MFIIMVIVSSVITPKYFVKIKRKNWKNTRIFIFFIRKKNPYTFRYWIQEGNKIKTNFLAIKSMEHISLLFST